MSFRYVINDCAVGCFGRSRLVRIQVYYREVSPRKYSQIFTSPSKGGRSEQQKQRFLSHPTIFSLLPAGRLSRFGEVDILGDQRPYDHPDQGCIYFRPRADSSRARRCRQSSKRGRDRADSRPSLRILNRFPARPCQSQATLSQALELRKWRMFVGDQQVDLLENYSACR